MAVSWSSEVNQKVLRNGNGWEEPETVIEDKTRSGKQKRRLYSSSEKRTFQVSFNFNMDEYNAFRTWVKYSIRKGALSFEFPQIDSTDKTVMAEYRMKKGGFPKYSNESGTVINCKMVWEEE